ncbi:unnamed protein product [Blepharisma stoltei]|uniref:Uncharacterized protein n=1 Tax=Blepharisma stoltei TaxID=1481888 RepID=A0AAU9IGB4_9CILI|nr:unnamed protein product [Blepharisma stoltei]
MKSFKLRSYTRLEEDLNYGAYELPGFNYLFVLNNAVSSKDNRYIACPVWRSDLGLLIRIWDTNAKNSSNIISEIYASQLYTLIYPVSMQFIGNSILTLYISYGNEYWSYKINENYLIFPKMSKEEYSEMTNLWGTNSFYLYIIAENANGEVASKYLYFNREVRGKKSDNYWWIWVLVSIAIVACIIGGGLYIRKLLKAHRRRSLELILMREIHNKEGLQDTELN